MKKTRCCIIDDEPIAIDILKGYVLRLESLSFLGGFEDPLQAFGFLGKQEVDLLFLDIQMPELNGLKLYGSLRHRPEVILTTAHRKYALEGFEIDAVDYLLKPISFERFLKAIDKFHHRSIPSAASIYIRADRKQVRLWLEDILYVEGLKDYVRIYLKDGKNWMTKDWLGQFQEKLPADRFLRVHRSFLVAIDKIEAYSQHQLEVGGRTIPIGRTYQRKVAAQLTD